MSARKFKRSVTLNIEMDGAEVWMTTVVVDGTTRVTLEILQRSGQAVSTTLTKAEARVVAARLMEFAKS